MKTLRIHLNRVTPYVAPRRPLHPETGKFSGTSVKPVANYSLTTAAFTALSVIGGAMAQTPLPTEPESTLSERVVIASIATGIGANVAFFLTCTSLLLIARYIHNKNNRVGVMQEAPEPVNAALPEIEQMENK